LTSSQTQKTKFLKQQIKFKAMKKVSFILAFILMPILAGAQSVFDKYEDVEGVTSVVVNQKMFSMIASMGISADDPEAQEYLDMVKKITGMRVFTTGDPKVSADMLATVNGYLKTSSLQELMRVKDGEQNIKFYAKEGKDENHVKELLMFMTGMNELTKNSDVNINGKKLEVETVLLSLTGDIDLRKIGEITNGMNVPGGDQLKKVKKSSE
jgi:hypothetical protein